MATRRFGPDQAPGTVILEKPAERRIQQGARGVAAYAGIFEKGDPFTLIECISRRDLERKMGGRMAASFAPDAARDYFKLGQGAGRLFNQRITDGTEVKAEFNLKSRRDPLTDVITVKAKSAGQWAGKRKLVVADATAITETSVTLTASPAMKLNEWAGATLYNLDEAKNYPVVGNAITGEINVAIDSLMVTDGGDITDLFVLVLENEDRHLAVLIKDGQLFPDTEWGMEVYQNGQLLLDYPDMSSDPTSTRYFVPTINSDTENFEIEVTNLWGGAITADIRPANSFGLSSALTATVLTLPDPHYIVTPDSGTPDGTVDTFTFGSFPRSDVYTLTFTSPTAYDVSSALQDHVFPSGTVDTPYAAEDQYAIGWKVNQGSGGNEFAIDDVITIIADFLPRDELINGLVFPDVTNVADRRTSFRIIDNDERTVSVALWDDMTTVGTAGDEFRLQWPEQADGGYDGIDGITTAMYQQAYDVLNSPLNQLKGKGMGLVKLATPGITTVDVQKAGIEYAEAKNYQYRIEVPANITSELAAISFIEGAAGVGRSDFAVTTFPSFSYIVNPTGAGDKLVSLSGMIHGIEARFSRIFQGYHQAVSGIDAVLRDITRLTTGEAALDEEILNPKGIAVVKKELGDFIIWGDRNLAKDPAWMWKHQREVMSGYELDLSENFNWIIWQLNTRTTDIKLVQALRGYFKPEYAKEAIVGDKFEDAAQIKVDEEINTEATRQAGKLYSEVKLTIVGVVEQLILTMSKEGIFESIA